MNASELPQTPPAKPPRSVLVTVVACAVIAMSGLMLPISFISAIMVAMGSPGTSESDPIGYFTVVLAPAIAFASGIGMLFRKAWARYALLVLLLLALGAGLQEMTRAPTETTTTISPSGVKTTTLGSQPAALGPFFVLCLGLFITLLLPRVRDEFRPAPKPTAPL